MSVGYCQELYTEIMGVGVPKFGLDIYMKKRIKENAVCCAGWLIIYYTYHLLTIPYLL